MFTGIVTDIGEITSLKPTAQGQLHRLRIACAYDRATIADGASIACNGVCLTVVASGVDTATTITIAARMGSVIAGRKMLRRGAARSSFTLPRSGIRGDGRAPSALHSRPHRIRRARR